MTSLVNAFFFARHGAGARRATAAAVLASALLVLTGCAVGPDFQRPAAPDDDAYAATDATIGDSAPSARLSQQMFDRAGKVRADWYRIFGSARLDALIQQALADSPTLAAGRARLESAREAVNAREGALFPQIGATAGVSRRRASGIDLGIDDPMFINVFNLYQGRISASYDLDIFGKTRRRIEQSAAELDFTRYRVLDTYVTLVNNIVATAIAEAGLNAAIDVTRKIADSQQHTLDIVAKQVQYGTAIDADASQIRTRLARTRASLEPLKKQRAVAVNRLATLVGATPGHFQDPQFSLDELQLPASLPVSIPSALVRQRPDILAAESLVHAASAQIGVATANLLPDFSIDGYYSREGLTLGDLTNPMNALYELGASVSAPIFAGGRLRAQKRAAQDDYVAALADYRATALSAFGEVANSLRSLESDARALRDQQIAVDEARNNLDTVQAQVNNGAADYIGLYTAEQQYQQTLLDATDARVTRYRDSADLFRALGGGWWNAGTSPLADPAPARTADARSE
ncbi:efflux transporter outer membrane subunit [Salinisphaera aquimarina]|uniref:Efflux transporter outer membrane subunit n=1 Tax=Salinisphaera aquimarina TaxID=2094031 RepID=A0ABV7ETL9_9GAMM